MSAAGQFAPSGNLWWLSPPDSRARLRPRSVRGFSEVPIAAAKSSALLAAGPSGIEGEAQAVWPQGEERSGSPSVVCFPELWDLHPGLLQQASCREACGVWKGSHCLRASLLVSGGFFDSPNRACGSQEALPDLAQ